jgi:hypothetical protein
MAHSTDMRIIPEAMAQLMVKELTLHIMNKYGHEKPQKVGDSGPTYKEDPASKLILPDHLT